MCPFLLNIELSFKTFINLFKQIKIFCMPVIFTDFLQVNLMQVPVAYLSECVEFKAKIEGYPKYRRVIWIKNDQNIDLTDTKYEGSKHDGDSAVLCIKDVKENDDAIYTIEVSNELEKVKRSQKLVVVKSRV